MQNDHQLVGSFSHVPIRIIFTSIQYLQIMESQEGEGYPGGSYKSRFFSVKKYIFSQLWRLKVQNQNVGRVDFS